MSINLVNSHEKKADSEEKKEATRPVLSVRSSFSSIDPIYNIVSDKLTASSLNSIELHTASRLARKEPSSFSQTSLTSSSSAPFYLTTKAVLKLTSNRDTSQENNTRNAYAKASAPSFCGQHDNESVNIPASIPPPYNSVSTPYSSQSHTLNLIESRKRMSDIIKGSSKEKIVDSNSIPVPDTSQFTAIDPSHSKKRVRGVTEEILEEKRAKSDKGEQGFTVTHFSLDPIKKKQPICEVNPNNHLPTSSQETECISSVGIDRIGNMEITEEMKAVLFKERQCTDCGEIFYFIGSICMNNNGGTMYICRYCEEPETSTDSLMRHIMKQHIPFSPII